MMRASMVLALAVAAPASAQVQAGDSILIRSTSFGSHPVPATVVAIEAAELAVAVDGSLQRLPLGGIREIRKVTGRKRKVMLGASLGFMLGGSVMRERDEYGQLRTGTASTLMALAGAGIGAFIGHRIVTPRYSAVSLTTIRSDVVPGMRIRAMGRSTEGVWQEGTVIEVSADSLTIEGADGNLRQIGRAGLLVKAPYSVGRATGRGALMGFAIGAIGGAVAGASSEPGTGLVRFSTEEMAFFGAIGGGLIGATIGTAAGALTTVVHWENVTGVPSRVRIAPQVTGSRFGVGIRVEL